MKKLTLLVLCILAQSIFAEDGTLESDARSQPNERTWNLSIDLRPSWNANESSTHMENEIGAEYRPSLDTGYGYTQEFLVRFNAPAGLDASDYYRSRFGDGYLYGNFGGLVDLGQSLSFTYEPRLYFPTSGLEEGTGFILGTRQYLKLDWQITSFLGLSFAEVPILRWHSRAGYEAREELYANHTFENRIEVGPELSFFQEKLKISLPLIFQARRHRNFEPEAIGNNTWTYSLWFAPEAVMQVAESTHVGLSYYSDYFTDDNFTNWDLGTGLGHGTFQAVIQQSL